MSVSVNGTSGLVFNDASTQNTAATGFGFKNRIINGSCMIDQRNAGASVTPANAAYTLDRWQVNASQSSKLSIQQSTVAPAGFTNSLLVTSLAATSLGSTDFFAVFQPIEGYNVSDLGFGAAGASSITVSFWVRSSLTGVFGASVWNDGQTRCYPFSYTINAANTWEQKFVTIAGDTSGTWLKNNGRGMSLYFALGVGSTYSNTAGSWYGSIVVSATGATSVVGTNGATFYITGVQLEKGSTATSFDYRPYGTELQLCQRYYQILGEIDSTLGFAAYSLNGDFNYAAYPYKVVMRATPTGTYNFNAPANATVSFSLGTDIIRHILVANSTGRIASAGSTNAIRLSAEL